ncbi:alpha/beta hydrolase [Pseudoclavibacter sp. VKM Ac-2888]|uniref:alpha/beta hydrolase n=1 Tax=Pseudoclavibacter sp. VKM Ac-2888 TaxID=2783830 RepID=UPI00188A8B79|nr:alpha/beta fold hydrolase [Pseudoclavibacter sp. VKM Ac-2888]MBF4548857.1 alpha/beta fold hydrolase [Pseudoclavibacter sp. VKM Ac-2888]
MKLHTITTGDGPRKVALVHGIGASAELWGSLAGRIAESGEYTAIAVDLRGHGESPRAESYRLDEFVDDLIETLPHDLHSAVGHSLGGALLVRAVPRLRPERAIYLDPGFKLGLPSEGVGARVFWALSGVTLPLVMLAGAASGTNDTKRYSAETRALNARAKKRFDGKMTVGIFDQVAHAPYTPAVPVVPSTIVLSAEGKAVVPAPMPAELEALGWQVRQLPEVGHPFWLHDVDASYGAIRDLI